MPDTTPPPVPPEIEGETPRFTQWCALTHGHGMNDHKQGEWVRFVDHATALSAQSAAHAAQVGAAKAVQRAWDMAYVRRHPVHIWESTDDLASHIEAQMLAPDDPLPDAEAALKHVREEAVREGLEKAAKEVCHGCREGVPFKVPGDDSYHIDKHNQFWVCTARGIRRLTALEGRG